MSKEYRLLPSDIQEKAKELGPYFKIRPNERVVITGFEAATPLGNADETFEAMLKGKSAIKEFNTDNFRTNIGGVLTFDISALYPTDKDKRMTSRVAAIAEIIALSAANKSGILGEDGLVLNSIDKRRTGVWIGTGIGPVQEIIDIDRSINSVVESDGSINRRIGSKRVDTFTGLRIFPQDVAARAAMRIGAQGWSGSTVEACATGASNIVDAYRLIKDGHLDVAIAGGVEDALYNHGDTAISTFTAMRILSARNDNPDKASRPYDRDRDGFVLSSGGAVVILESLESAKKRNAPILAEILGAYKTIDGDRDNPTSLDPINVARTIREVLIDQETGQLRDLDAAFTHATSTREGDKLEAQSLRNVFGNHVKNIPITAIKSMLGHMLGGSGSESLVAATQSLNKNILPYTKNLENIDEEFKDLNIVRFEPLQKEISTALSLSYGFGGFNAAILLGKYYQ